ncbi:MAG: hypothetical protein ACXIUZ_06630 [Lysobacteraceae bacterium]
MTHHRRAVAVRPQARHRAAWALALVLPALVACDRSGSGRLEAQQACAAAAADLPTVVEDAGATVWPPGAHALRLSGGRRLEIPSGEVVAAALSDGAVTLFGADRGDGSGRWSVNLRQLRWPREEAVGQPALGDLLLSGLAWAVDGARCEADELQGVVDRVLQAHLLAVLFAREGAGDSPVLARVDRGQRQAWLLIPEPVRNDRFGPAHVVIDAARPGADAALQLTLRPGTGVPSTHQSPVQQGLAPDWLPALQAWVDGEGDAALRVLAREAGWDTGQARD